MKRTTKLAARPVSTAHPNFWAIEHYGAKILETAAMMDAVAALAGTEKTTDPIDPAIVHVIKHFIGRGADNLRRDVHALKQMAYAMKAVPA